MIDVVAGIGVALGFLLGIMGHELAHHLLADKLGDRSPRFMGRLKPSLQKQADPLGTYILPGVFIAAAIFLAPLRPMFGWGKRHDLNLRMLRGRAPLLVLVAGPGATLALGIGTGAVTRALSGGGGHFSRVAFWTTVVLASMTVVDLLPMPGRDGGRILGRFLSPQASMKMEELIQYEVLFLILALFFLGQVTWGMIRPVCQALTGIPNCVDPARAFISSPF